MTKPTVTSIKISEAKALQKIAIATFKATYADKNTEENMQNYLAKNFSTEQILLDLQNEESLFYFAKIEAEIVGYLKLNFGTAQTEPNYFNSVEIERIYVLQKFQGQKIGQILYNKTLQIATQKNTSYIWLGVWEENPKAIQFYQKMGFQAFDKHVFILGNEHQTDIMMKLEL